MHGLVVLADANSFFASCEMVFDPSLTNKPVVVLSNNDGCVVARSPAAKRLGIVNGTPWFKIREQAARDHVVARSSNYELYASLSARMMAVMTAFLPDQEVYSIDECFLHATGGPEHTVQTCTRMRTAVLDGVGIPVSVGIAPTKTLAKIANHWAKQHPSSRGVTLWNEADKLKAKQILSTIPIEDVWGVGRRLTRKLQAMGITNALQLRDTDPAFIRHRFSMVLERTVLELRGIPCIEAESDAAAGVRTTQILCSRMFSSPIRGIEGVRQALGVYAQKACGRLRRQHSLCSQVHAFCATSPFNTENDYVVIRGSHTLLDPSDNPLLITKAAYHALGNRFDPHARYIRAGVLLSGLYDAESFHTLDGLQAAQDTRGIGEALEAVTRRFGPARVGIGYGGVRGGGKNNEDTGAKWTMRRDMLSPRSTTRWDEMAVVHAD